MGLSTIASLALRGLLILSAAVVLGLSVTINKWWSPWVEGCRETKHCNVSFFTTIQAGFEYCIFVGAFGLLDGFVGVLAAFVDAVPWIAVIVFDALAAIFMVAGGARLAAWMAGDNCADDGPYKDICTKIEADSAFLFIGFIVLVVLMILTFLTRNSRSGGKFGSSAV